ncbi:GntR family transcriptional regulator [Rubrobacter taiwanensis]|uniref:GntR family transcriptional regulator n=1 Tax=Rubrobacter taiwanensis TaxID=185139 RepID=A0A4R1BQX2_9ACTN|nr:GntR family transcriptional regulator [Rubrobacter taiwanensis]TCJ19988.1 GntR family transcriptional regulator [Rubrobacter taiwanensis]
MRESLTQRSYNRIKDDILSHRLLPRQPLVEAELAAKYNISKTPVREALIILAREGIVEMNAFRGMRVRDFTPRDAREIYELREILEPLALERAIPNMSNEDTADLRKILDDAWRAVERGDQRELSRLNRAFHSALVAKCDNSRIVATLNQLQDQIRVMTLRFWKVQATYVHEAKQHEAIMAAVEARDAKRAAELLREHIVEFRERYVREWEE